MAQDASIVASDLRGGSHKARARFRAIPMASLPPVALSALLKKLMFLLDSAASQDRRSVNETLQMCPLSPAACFRFPAVSRISTCDF
ncbi:hypothetical protein EAS61_35705 [Bradyrhizobium zhanjiangense]|uniref:Uncharacterized protein n=1 Tax=Bradyrhizobium zhanjiangense TaxID=1325107 RepID=A0A4Q0Q8W9_9BRAD|nr:hypothetical protein EAS61_35705 [Bradyrhizobium zhanjiangense]